MQKCLKGEPLKVDEKDAEMADEIEIDFEVKLYKERAFEGYEGIERQLMKNAADYSDQWFKEGNVQFNVYYVCKSGHLQWPCNTAIESMAWDRLHDDPQAVKQRWYCKMCTAKYKTKFGVLVEFVLEQGGKKVAMYALGDLPPFDIQDAKLMKIEETFSAYKTPEALLAALPKVTPLDRTHFLKETNMPGHWSFDNKMFETISKFDWNQLYNLGPTAMTAENAMHGAPAVADAAAAAAAVESDLEEC